VNDGDEERGRGRLEGVAQRVPEALLAQDAAAWGQFYEISISCNLLKNLYKWQIISFKLVIFLWAIYWQNFIRMS
jgi:hypothetical protein